MRAIKKIHCLLFLVGIIFLAQSRFCYALMALDHSFGENGVSTTDFDGHNAYAYAVAEQADGKILVAGMSDNGSDTDMALARYNKDGSLDDGFNNGGRISVDVKGYNDAAYALRIQKDGKIILAGYAGNGKGEDIALVRLTPTGELDLDFNGTGKVVLPTGEGDSRAYSLLIQDDGHILAAGAVQFGESKGATLIRLNKVGSLDSGFGDGGKTIIGQGNDSAAYAVTSQNDGKILLAGSVKTSSGHFDLALFRVTSAGLADPSFGDGGVISMGTGSSDAAVYSLAIQPDHKILVAGFLDNGEYKKMLLGRLTDNGATDQTFGDNGLVISDYGFESIAYAAVLLPSGSILTTGYGSDGSKKNVILAQHSKDGSVDGNDKKNFSVQDAAIVGTSKSAEVMKNSSQQRDAASKESIASVLPTGLILTPVGSNDSIGRAMHLRADGSVLVAGSSENDNSDFALMSYNSASVTSSSASAVLTDYYSIGTTPVTGIKRTSAISGGTIVLLNNDIKSACESNCNISCANSTDTTCLSTCSQSCAPPTITGRGVCYSIIPKPVYRSTSSSTSSDSSQGSQTADTTTTPASNIQLVRSGQTSDGSGTGSYGSDINKITPDTGYYARAYAVLSDNSIIYGNEQSFKTSDACFIATAAYGSILEKHVMVLRLFRDRYLKTTELGQKFIDFYYRWSPAAAEIIARHMILQKVVRIGLLPLIGLSYFMLYTSLNLKLLILFFVAGTIVVVLSQRFLIWKWKLKIRIRDNKS